MAHAPAEGLVARPAAKHATMVQFAEQLQTLRKQQRLTQAELARRVGLQQSAISMMESAQCRPQPETLMKLASQLGVPVEQLWPRPIRNGSPRRKRTGRRK